MSTAPVDDLPVMTWPEAKARGFAPIRILASERRMSQRRLTEILSETGAPVPVARIRMRGHGFMDVYDVTDVGEFLAAHANRDDATVARVLLPVVDQGTATRRGLVTLEQAARMLGTRRATLAAWRDRADDKPEPVALLATGRGRAPILYRASDLRALMESGRGARVVASSPRLIGTSTPTAGQPYVWRDPRRWRG